MSYVMYYFHILVSALLDIFLSFSVAILGMAT